MIPWAKFVNQPHYCSARIHGNLCPFAPWTALASAEVIVPLIRTSSRKFSIVTAIPTWPLVTLTSVLLTFLSPLMSPISMFALTGVVGSTCEEASVTSQGDSQCLDISHTGERHGHGRAGEGRGTDGARPGGDASAVANYAGRKVKDEAVTAAAVAAFHAGRSIKRKVNVECARSIMSLTRDR